MPKPPVKKTKKIAKAQAYGETIGKLEAEYHFKNTQKGLEKSLREHLSHWIDKINPLELTAVLGMTYIVHDLIISDEGLLARVTSSYANPLFAPSAWVYRGATGGELAEEYAPELAPKKGGLTINIITPEIGGWVTSFAIAYIIVKHGGQIALALGEIVKSLIDLIKFLLPVGGGAGGG